MELTDQYGLPSGNRHKKGPPVVFPPLNIRAVIDRIALFIFRNGTEFESRFMDRDGKDPKYNFFCKSDPYHDYYKRKLSQHQERGEPTDYDEKLRPDIPKSHKYLVPFPKGIKAEQLDKMMLTAQFDARYGSNFLYDLEDSKVVSDAQLSVLVDPSHKSYTNLVTAYSDLVDPSIIFIKNLRNSAADMTTVLERCFHTLQWDRFQKLRWLQIKEQRLWDIIETAKIHGVDLEQPLPGSIFADHPEEPEPKRPKLDKSALVDQKILMMSSTLIEQTRSKHAEIERLERMVMKELEIEQPSSRETLFIQGHRLRHLIMKIMHKTERLVEAFDVTTRRIEDEIAPLGAVTNVFTTFRDRLQEIQEYHREHRSGNRVVDLDEDDELISKEDFGSYLDFQEPNITFTEEEDFGRYLDLHDMYNQYINSEFGDRVQYSAYLDVFSQPEKIPRPLKLSKQYKRYIKALLDYLIDFFQRTEPLQDLSLIFSKVETDFKEQYADGKVEGWENRGQEIEVIPSQQTGGTSQLDKKRFAKSKQIKKIALREAKVKELCNLLDKTIKRTKQSGEKKLKGKEFHEEDGKPPMGWDWTPVPYSIYQFHDLGQEFKCEVCGKYSFWGRRAFERHFNEMRHQLRLSIKNRIHED